MRCCEDIQESLEGFAAFGALQQLGGVKQELECQDGGLLYVLQIGLQQTASERQLWPALKPLVINARLFLWTLGG